MFFSLSPYHFRICLKAKLTFIVCLLDINPNCYSLTDVSSESLASIIISLSFSVLNSSIVTTVQFIYGHYCIFFSRRLIFSSSYFFFLKAFFLKKELVIAVSYSLLHHPFHLYPIHKVYLRSSMLIIVNIPIQTTCHKTVSLMFTFTIIISSLFLSTLTKLFFIECNSDLTYRSLKLLSLTLDLFPLHLVPCT